MKPAFLTVITMILLIVACEKNETDPIDVVVLDYRDSITGVYSCSGYRSGQYQGSTVYGYYSDTITITKVPLKKDDYIIFQGIHSFKDKKFYYLRDDDYRIFERPDVQNWEQFDHGRFWVGENTTFVLIYDQRMGISGFKYGRVSGTRISK
jgi:hypothetical protein